MNPGAGDGRLEGSRRAHRHASSVPPFYLRSNISSCAELLPSYFSNVYRRENEDATYYYLLVWVAIQCSEIYQCLGSQREGVRVHYILRKSAHRKQRTERRKERQSGKKALHVNLHKSRKVFQSTKNSSTPFRNSAHHRSTIPSANPFSS